MTSKHRTMLDRLGFVDPDQSEPRHTLACRHLARLAKSGDLDHLISYTVKRPGAVDSWHFRKSREPNVALPMYYRKGKFKAQIGFADVAILCEGFVEIVHEGSGEVITEPYWVSAAFEVKIHGVGVEEVVRQINFYRGHLEESQIHWVWILATAYPVPSHEVETLHQAGIAHCLLGHSFEHWCEEIGAKPDHGQKQFKF